MTTPLRIKLQDPALRDAFIQTLAAGNCSVADLSDGTFSVVHLEARTQREARLEVAFFVGAWQTKHPHAPAELLG